MRRVLSFVILALAAALPAFAQKQFVVETPSATASATLQSGATANGNGTVADVGGYSVAVIAVDCAGCSSTIVNFEGSTNNSDFTPMIANRIGSTGFQSSATSASGKTWWSLPLVSMRYLRARISNYAAGTITVTADMSMAVPARTDMTVSLGSAVTLNSDAFHGSAVPGIAQLVAGSDGTSSWNLRTTSAGRLQVDLSQTAVNATAIKVDGSAATQPVSAAALPLPSGAATSAKQPALGTAGSPSSDVITVQGTTSMTALKVDGSAVTQPVSAAALPLPSGAATSANQSTEITALQLIDNLPNTLGSTTSGQSGALALGAVTTGAPSYTTAQSNALSLTTAGALRVDGSGVTQPVSGTVTVQQSTASNLKVDLSGTAANTTAIKVDGSAATQPVSGSVTVTQGTGTNLHIVCDSGCSSSSGFGDNGAFTFGTTSINPIGAVFDDTSSNTATENSAAVLRMTQNKGLHVNLRNAAGTEIGTSSNPVQVTLANTGANATAVKVDGSAVTQPVSGTVTVTQGTGTNLHIVCDSGCSSSAGFADNGAFTFGTTAVNPIAGVFDDTSSNTATENSAAIARITQNKALHVNFRNASGTEIGTSSNPIQVTLANTGSNATAVKVDGSAATQPVSGTVTANAGTGTFTVSGTVTANAGTNLNTSALAVESGGNLATVASAVRAEDTASADADKGVGMLAIRKATPANTSGTDGDYEYLQMAAGRLWVDASGKTLTVDGSGVTQPVSAASLPLPSGAATSANQSTEITALQLIDNLPNTLGSTTSGQSGALALGAVTTAAPSYTTAQSNALSLTTAGALRVDGSGVTQPVSGTVSITSNSSVNVAQMNGVAVASPDANGYALEANAATATSGAAASACNILSAASNNATNCKGSAGNLYGYELYNTTTTVYYLRLYNLSSSPTCSSATGFIRSIPIPPAAAAGQVGGAVTNYTVPVNFGTGIGYCITAGSSSTDNTSAATGVFGEIRYK